MQATLIKGLLKKKGRGGRLDKDFGRKQEEIVNTKNKGQS
jgi:hypothetical protein